MNRLISCLIAPLALSGCLVQSALSLAADPSQADPRKILPEREVTPLEGTWRVTEQVTTVNPCGATRPLLFDPLTIRRGAGTSAGLEVVEYDATLRSNDGQTRLEVNERLDFRPQLDCDVIRRFYVVGASGERELSVSVSETVEWSGLEQPPAVCAQALADYLGWKSYPEAVDCTVEGTAKLTLETER